MKNLFIPVLLLFFVITSCKSQVSDKGKENIANQEAYTVETAIGRLILPSPYSTESVRNETKLLDWPAEGLPTAPEGFIVSKFAGDFDNPRATYVGPNGDLFVVESNTKSSADRITILQDKAGDGNYATREIFIDGLNQPYGMLILGEYFYVANTDGLYRYSYQPGQIKLEAEGEKILDLPAGGYNNH